MQPAFDAAPTIDRAFARRLLSRVTSPFASKSRAFTDFFIELDDPHKHYSSGDLVKGQLRLRVVKPIRVTHLVVSLYGFAQVYKTPGSVGDGGRASRTYLGTGRGATSGEYLGNGFASLFEHEQVLCGDGRLAEGLYQFNFELAFPDRDLPSGIEFERGTISYLVTATMTRPTSIMPTVSCEHSVHFVQRIDISVLDPPKPRTITLEPLPKRVRARVQARRLGGGDENARQGDSPQPGEHDLNCSSRPASPRSNPVENQLLESPAPSEVSEDTDVSGNPRLSWRVHSPDTDGGINRMNASKQSLGPSGRIITATVESLTGGCLRGDTIGIKVNVTHTKPIRSLYGVIVTLYRQARVDMHPAIPLGPTPKDTEGKHEDYYPKSLTGLGGLSLSGAGSSHIFRKDLSQMMAPLYVDPASLTAEVNAKLRVPEDVFPTISTVPGAMISFRYYLEVVLDIQGKLSGQDRTLSYLGSLSGTPTPSAGMDGSDKERSALTPFASNFVDTVPIRRQKSVVACVFEVIVGTKDSERRRGKRRVEALGDSEQQQEGVLDASDCAHVDKAGSANMEVQPTEHRALEERYHDTPGGRNLSHRCGGCSHYGPPVPLPPFEDESALTEKERLQRAEARLLPSHPDSEGTQSDPPEEPTAPYLADEYVHAEPALSMRTTSSTYRRSSSWHGSIAPIYNGSVTESSTSHVAVGTDDKQELRRRQLEAEASAPPNDEHEASN